MSHDPRVMASERGPITRYIDIVSNDPAAPQVRFVIMAYVLDK